jgi:hypothetical protein
LLAAVFNASLLRSIGLAVSFLPRRFATSGWLVVGVWARRYATSFAESFPDASLLRSLGGGF